MQKTHDAHSSLSAKSQHHTAPYGMFALNLAMSFVPMYLAMFTMIDTASDFRNNLNMFYMALTMLAPMGVIMLFTMPGMYPNRALNAGLVIGLTLLTVVAFAATRKQTAIGDQQFIASMIPHHSGAILMCREAPLKDPELAKLCQDIMKAQRAEIEQMRSIAKRLSER